MRDRRTSSVACRAAESTDQSECFLCRLDTDCACRILARRRWPICDVGRILINSESPVLSHRSPVCGGGRGGAFLYRRRARGEVCPAVVPPERSERAHKGTVGRAGHCLITRSAPLQTGGGTWPAKPKPTRSEGLATMLPRGVLAPIRGGCGRAVVRLLATSLVVFQLLFVLWLQPTGTANVRRHWVVPRDSNRRVEIVAL